MVRDVAKGGREDNIEKKSLLLFYTLNCCLGSAPPSLLYCLLNYTSLRRMPRIQIRTMLRFWLNLKFKTGDEIFVCHAIK